MRTIWKYELTQRDLLLPANARILTVQTQRGVPCLWVLLDDAERLVPRRIAIVGTGHPLPDACTTDSYIGTYQDGPFVWHVFELPT